MVFRLQAVDSKPINVTFTTPSCFARPLARFFSAAMVRSMRDMPFVPDALSMLPDVSTTSAML